MFWEITVAREVDDLEDAPEQWDGRFVLHRHHDHEGPHLDLRLERDGYLLGWRISGTSFVEGMCAVEKAPHPVAWLDHDGDAVREDAGMYAWKERAPDGGTLLLAGETSGIREVEVRRGEGLAPDVIRSIRSALDECGIDPGRAAQLVKDGIAARERSAQRLCGLARELDGAAFDEGVWRKVQRHLTLDEIHAQLRAYEVRFDKKYPPQPVSRPERLTDQEGPSRSDTALAIVQGSEN